MSNAWTVYAQSAYAMPPTSDPASVARELFDHIKSSLIIWLETGVAMDIEDILRQNNEYSDFVVQFMARDLFIPEFGFTVPKASFVKEMREFGPLIEVGSGRGLLSTLLRINGIDIIATDANPHKSQYGWTYNPDWQVQELSAKEAVRAYPNRSVLCSWPCYDKPWAHEMACEMVSGQRLCLIGEGYGGCTGDDALFEMLHMEFEETTTDAQSDIIFSWQGIRDQFTTYVKK